MSDGSPCGDITRKGSAANDGNGKLMTLIKVLVLVASLTVTAGYLSNRSGAQQRDDRISSSWRQDVATRPLRVGHLERARVAQRHVARVGGQDHAVAHGREARATVQEVHARVQRALSRQPRKLDSCEVDLGARCGDSGVLFVSSLRSGAAPNCAPSLRSVAGLLVAKWGFLRGPRIAFPPANITAV